jgi:hypothetical protein
MTGDEIRRLDATARNETDQARRASRQPDRDGRVCGSRVLAGRHLVIGGLSVLIDVSLLYVLHSVVGVGLSAATSVAFLGSLLFVLYRRWVFTDSDRGGTTTRRA